MRQWITVGSVGIAGIMLAGCATSMGAKTEKASLNEQVAALETQVNSLNQRVDELSQRQIGQESAQTTGSTTAQTQAARPLSAKQVQVALKSSGHYSGPIDGKLGPQTREAVKSFQRAQGLTPDGKVGSKTTVALAKFLNRE